jgi:hypothetical protein
MANSARRRCFRTIGENGETLPGLEKPAFAIALGGELLERINRGQTLEPVQTGGRTNLAELFAGSRHEYDLVVARRNLADLIKVNEDHPSKIVTDCAIEVFEVLRRARAEIAIEAERLLEWIADVWASRSETGTRKLKPTKTSHWTTLAYTRGRDGLSVFLDDSVS